MIRSMKLSPRGAFMSLGALALVGLVLAGCAGGAGSSSNTSGDPMAHEPVAHIASASAVAVVKVTATPSLGRVIVDSEGMTLYDSHRDDPMLYQFNRPPIPSCYEACADVWPPLLTDFPPKATGGAEQDLLGTIRRRDGSRQVTYDGHPLYAFVRDVQPGDTDGDSVLSLGSEWHALEPDGEEPVDQGR